MVDADDTEPTVAQLAAVEDAVRQMARARPHRAPEWRGLLMLTQRLAEVVARRERRRRGRTGISPQ